MPILINVLSILGNSIYREEYHFCLEYYRYLLLQTEQSIEHYKSEANYPQKDVVEISYKDSIIWTCNACGLPTFKNQIEYCYNEENSS